MSKDVNVTKFVSKVVSKDVNVTKFVSKFMSSPWFVQKVDTKITVSKLPPLLMLAIRTYLNLSCGVLCLIVHDGVP